MRAVFGFVIYGCGDPWAPTATAPVVYTDAELPSSGLPSELTGATVYPRVVKRPGVNWGADPRNPAGTDGRATVTILDDALGTLGTLWLQDPTSERYGLEQNRLTAATTSVTSAGATAPTSGRIHYLENEAVLVTTNSSTPRYTSALTLTRGRCGSVAQVHAVRPAEYSEGEDGSEDRLYLDRKPDWQHGFRCGVYLFRLDQFGAIESWILRRGVVDAEPTPVEWPHYEVPIRWIESEINSHTVGGVTQQVTLGQAIRVTELKQGRPEKAQVWLDLKKAEALFNEPLSPRGSTAVGVNATYVASLNTRMQADTSAVYQLVCEDGADTWVYKILSLAVGLIQTSGGRSYQICKVSLQLDPGGFKPGAKIIVDATSGSPSRLRDWYYNAIQGSSFSSTYASGGVGTAAPKIKLRLRLRATVVTAFLKLCISRDGSSGGTYDTLIGNVGAGLPSAWFAIGVAALSPVDVGTNTKVLAELNQLLTPVNTYFFDLTQGISLRDFLTNEFIATQLLLGSKQDGDITLRSWVHEVAATVTLKAPIDHRPGTGERLAAIKRLDLEAGTDVLTLEPLYRRSVRWMGAQKIQESEVQKLRFWRQGLNLTVADVTSGALSDMVRAFYKVFGGAPRVYEVPISVTQLIDDDITFGDAVAWSNTTVPTPSGIGIDDDFFVIGVDLDWDAGRANLRLLQNTLLAEPVTTTTGGHIAPTLQIDTVTPVSSTVVDVGVSYVGSAALDLTVDHDDLFADIEANIGKLRLDTYDHAPLGEQERVGTVEAYPTIEILTSTSLRLTFDTAYLRGNYAAAEDLIVAGESKLNLPPRVSEEGSLDGALIEPDLTASSVTNSFIQTQPARLAFNSNRFLFGS